MHLFHKVLTDDIWADNKRIRAMDLDPWPGSFCSRHPASIEITHSCTKNSLKRSPLPVVSRFIICSSMCWIFIRTSKK